MAVIEYAGSSIRDRDRGGPKRRRPLKGGSGALKAEGVLAGYPDVLIDEPLAGWHGLRIEMKRSDGKGTESKAQQEVRGRLMERGFRSVVCHGARAACDELDAYMRGNRLRSRGSE